jgi:hypothetical protein
MRRLRKFAKRSSLNLQISVSSIRTVPHDGRLKPPIIARNEDLPEPERPTMLANSPGRTSISMPSTASISPRSEE